MEDAGHYDRTRSELQRKMSKHTDSKHELASAIQLITTIATDMEEQHEYEGKSQAHVEDLVRKIVALQQRFEDEISALKLADNAILTGKMSDSTDWEVAFPGLLKQAQGHSDIELEKRQKETIKKLKRTIAVRSHSLCVSGLVSCPYRNCRRFTIRSCPKKKAPATMISKSCGLLPPSFAH